MLGENPEAKSLIEALESFIAENGSLFPLKEEIKAEGTGFGFETVYVAGDAPKGLINVFGDHGKFLENVTDLYNKDLLVKSLSDFIAKRTGKKPGDLFLRSLFVQAGGNKLLGRQAKPLLADLECEAIACFKGDTIYYRVFADEEELKAFVKSSYGLSPTATIDWVKYAASQRILTTASHEIMHAAYVHALTDKELMLWHAWFAYGSTLAEEENSIITGFNWLKVLGYAGNWDNELLAFKLQKINALLSEVKEGPLKTFLAADPNLYKISVDEWDVAFFNKLGILPDYDVKLLAGSGKVLKVNWPKIPDALNPNIALKEAPESLQAISSANISAKGGVSFALTEVPSNPSFSSASLQNVQGLSVSKTTGAGVALKALQEGKEVKLSLLDLTRLKELSINEGKGLGKEAIEIDLLDLKKGSITLAAEALKGKNLALMNFNPAELNAKQIQLIQKKPSQGIVSVSVSQETLVIEASPSALGKEIRLSAEAPEFNYNNVLAGVEKEVSIPETRFSEVEPEIKLLIGNKKEDLKHVLDAFVSDSATPEFLSSRSFDSILSQAIDEQALPSSTRFVSISF
ncbi:hypothetical protein HZB89_00905, partial [archaeon]|nr:hypothetical protein [archaeon]